MSEFPTKFTFISGSDFDLAVPQGVAFNPALSLFWGTDKTPGAGSTVRRIFEYDSSYNLLRQSDNFDPADGLPANISQINGITWWAGKLYIGYNNYANDPKLGGIIVVEPSTLTIDAIHPAGNGHVEGCTIRNTQRGVEVFVFSNTGTIIERYDLATWTKQGEHDFGHWAVADDQAVYQGGGWFGDCMCLTLHGNQPRPQTIDVCRWDDDELEFIPLYRLTKPTLYCGQGFNFTPDLTEAFFAERNIIPTPDEYRIVRAAVSSVDVLPYDTTNPTSDQLVDLQYWYQYLTWDVAGPEWQLVDTQGNGTTGAGFDETHVYPIVDDDGTRKLRFDGEDGSSIALGNLFGASGWSVATLWFRGVVVHRNDANDIVMSFDGSGSLLGDGVIEVNRTTARTLTFRYTTDSNVPVTLTSLGDVFTLGVRFDLCVQLDEVGARIFVNGNEVASNTTPGQIGGANQNCFLGSNFLGQAGAQFDCWDVRVYDAVKDPSVLATYSLWSEGTMVDSAVLHSYTPAVLGLQLAPVAVTSTSVPVTVPDSGGGGEQVSVAPTTRTLFVPQGKAAPTGKPGVTSSQVFVRRNGRRR